MAVVGVRGDLREKYGIPELKTIDDYEKYLDAVAKNEPGLVPLDENSAGFGMYDIIVGSELTPKIVVSNTLLALDIKDKSGKIINIAETPQFLSFAKKMVEWNNKGFWSKNALVNKTPSGDSFLAGKSASMTGNSLDMSNKVAAANQKHPEWKAELVDLYNGKATFVNPYTSNGMSINANSKNPDRALMMLDLFRNNEDYFNLTTFGIKGKHYELTADKKIQTLNGADSGYKPDSGSPWGWRTAGLYKPLSDQPKAFTTIKENWTKTAVTNPLLNFVFDSSNVKNELAAIKNVKDQYRDPIYLGLMNNAEEAVKTLNAKYKEAGLDKVQAEAQKQIDEFLKNNK
jgi:putative aldouronate transport system substrate-binding protein